VAQSGSIEDLGVGPFRWWLRVDGVQNQPLEIDIEPEHAMSLRGCNCTRKVGYGQLGLLAICNTTTRQRDGMLWR